MKPSGALRSRAGPEVAKLAGLPAEVLARAREILKNLEALEVDERGRATLARGGERRANAPKAQLVLFAAAPDPVAEALRRELAGLDLDRLRPLDALNLLAEWKRRAG
jgi:DNA mismatch repair protein MutS